MSEVSFTFRVDEKLKEQFTFAANECERSVAELLREFMFDFVQQQNAADDDANFRQQVQQGLDAANSGNLISNVEVDAGFTKRREATRRRLNLAK